jgi:hypothetical protein
MTDASLANVVFAAFPVAFAALTVRSYRPRPEGGPAPPGVRIPMSASRTPDARA